MKNALLLSLGLVLFPCITMGQGLDFAITFRYNPGVVIGDLEPAANGFRQQNAYTVATEIELRGSAKIGWLLSLTSENIQVAKSSVIVSDIIEPFNIIHPYSSQLNSVYFRLGAQYNIRILEGDLSFGLLAGPGAAEYRRDWNVLNVLVDDATILSDAPAFTTLTDESATTLRLQAALRLQYTYWFTPALAFSAGLEYSQSHYISGGIETLRGERYEIADRGFFPGEVPSQRVPLIYDINYDRTTLMPDPSPMLQQFQFTLGMTSRL